MQLSIIGYDQVGAWHKTAETVEELLNYRNSAGITWINTEGLGDRESILKLAEAYGIHPLTIEDIMDTEQRPKAEEFDDYIFITFKAVNRQRLNTGEEDVFEQISLILMEDTVLTFQEIPGDSFDGIRKRILNNAGRIRRMGAGYLGYVIMDAIVDDYFLVLDSLGTDIEDFEDIAMEEKIKEESFIQDLRRMKQGVLKIRRIVWPVREGLSLLIHMDSKSLPDEMDPFLKDIYDAVVQAVETIENFREHIAGIMEIRLSMNSYRMNSVMKVLTIISTIFIPLTFIVGVYGMNFRYMPELEYHYAYPITWGAMAFIVAGMLIFFKRRHWL